MGASQSRGAGCRDAGDGDVVDVSQDVLGARPVVRERGLLYRPSTLAHLGVGVEVVCDVGLGGLLLGGDDSLDLCLTFELRVDCRSLLFSLAIRARLEVPGHLMGDLLSALLLIPHETRLIDVASDVSDLAGGVLHCASPQNIENGTVHKIVH